MATALAARIRRLTALVENEIVVFLPRLTTDYPALVDGVETSFTVGWPANLDGLLFSTRLNSDSPLFRTAAVGTARYDYVPGWPPPGQVGARFTYWRPGHSSSSSWTLEPGVLAATPHVRLAAIQGTLRPNPALQDPDSLADAPLPSAQLGARVQRGWLLIPVTAYPASSSHPYLPVPARAVEGGFAIAVNAAPGSNATVTIDLAGVVRAGSSVLSTTFRAYQVNANGTCSNVTATGLAPPLGPADTGAFPPPTGEGSGQTVIPFTSHSVPQGAIDTIRANLASAGVASTLDGTSLTVAPWSAVFTPSGADPAAPQTAVTTFVTTPAPVPPSNPAAPDHKFANLLVANAAVSVTRIFRYTGARSPATFALRVTTFTANGVTNQVETLSANAAVVATRTGAVVRAATPENCFTEVCSTLGITFQAFSS